MSRRARLLIFGVFFVLLAIPVVHVARGWAPVNPMCFRMVGQTAPEGNAGPLSTRTLTIEITNTGTVPIYLSDAKLLAYNPARGRRHVYAELEKFYLPITSFSGDPFAAKLAPMLPGTSRRTEVRIPEEAAARFDSSAPTIAYVYFSGPKQWGFDLSLYLIQQVPLKLARHVPKPRTDSATTPLEMAVSPP